MDTRNPSKLFLIDGLGALLSASLLGLVLARWEPVFGMPTRVLYVLAAIACVFAIYSFSCFLRKPENWRPYMKMIAVANLMYVCLTLGLVIFLYRQLTVLGLTYFGLELIVIVILVTAELKIAGTRSIS